MTKRYDLDGFGKLEAENIDENKQTLNWLKWASMSCSSARISSLLAIRPLGPGRIYVVPIPGEKKTGSRSHDRATRHHQSTSIPPPPLSTDHHQDRQRMGLGSSASACAAAAAASSAKSRGGLPGASVVTST